MLFREIFIISNFLLKGKKFNQTNGNFDGGERISGFEPSHNQNNCISQSWALKKRQRKKTMKTLQKPKYFEPFLPLSV